MPTHIRPLMPLKIQFAPPCVCVLDEIEHIIGLTETTYIQTVCIDESGNIAQKRTQLAQISNLIHVPNEQHLKRFHRPYYPSAPAAQSELTAIPRINVRVPTYACAMEHSRTPDVRKHRIEASDIKNLEINAHDIPTWSNLALQTRPQAPQRR